jgi:hypothetical protein
MSNNVTSSSTIFTIFFAALDGFEYNNTKIGQVDGTNTQGVVTVTVGANKIAMPAPYTDPRLNSFINDAGTPCAALSNRSGAPGSPGTSKNWILSSSITGPSLPDDGTMASALEVVANPYAVLPYNGFVYFMDYDNAQIIATTPEIAPGVSVSLALNGDPAYQFTWQLDEEEEDVQKVGNALVAIGDKIYALFNSYTQVSGSMDYKPGVVVRLGQTGAGARLSCQEPDRDPNDPLSITNNNDFCFTGKNATTLVHLTDGRTSTTKNYLGITCIGGQQNAGSGNGANSMLSLIDVNAYVALSSPLLGTYSLGGTTLNIKTVAVTPPSSVTANGITQGDSYVFVIASSYDSSWQTNFLVGQTKLSTLIDAAKYLTPIDMGNLTLIDNDTGQAGYFWTVAFAPTGNGCEGTLIVGRGNSDTELANTGDLLEFYPVGTAGFDAQGRQILDSEALYGSAGCVINTITLFPLTPGAKAIHLSILRSALPTPVANGTTSLADFHAEVLKKSKKKK